MQFVGRKSRFELQFNDTFGQGFVYFKKPGRNQVFPKNHKEIRRDCIDRWAFSGNINNRISRIDRQFQRRYPDGPGLQQEHVAVVLYDTPYDHPVRYGSQLLDQRYEREVFHLLILTEAVRCV